MIDLRGVPLSAEDVEALEEALDLLLKRSISIEQYNEVLIRIRNANEASLPERETRRANFLAQLGWIRRMLRDTAKRTSRLEYERRLEICSTCEFSRTLIRDSEQVCLKCGCILSLKAWIGTATCPDKSDLHPTGKWS